MKIFTPQDVLNNLADVVMELMAGGPGSGRHKDINEIESLLYEKGYIHKSPGKMDNVTIHSIEPNGLGNKVSVVEKSGAWSSVSKHYGTGSGSQSGVGLQQLKRKLLDNIKAGGIGSGRHKGSDNKLKAILQKEWANQTDEERRYIALKDPSHRQNKLFDEPFELTSGGPGSGRHPWGRKAKSESHRLMNRVKFLQKHRDASTLKKEGDIRHQDYAEKKSQGLNTRGKPIISTRQKVALKNTVIVAKDQQDKAEEIERLVTKALGGVQQHNNSPMDVVMKLPNGKTMGLEVKSLLLQKNDKITMKRESLAKKVQWGKDNKSNIGTVVVDLRNKGMQVYYRDGVGSFRIMHMTEVQGGLKGLTNAIGGK